MKGLVFILIVVTSICQAQLVVRPAVWQNAFQIYYNKGEYSYGGKFGESRFVPTLDLEYQFKKELDSLSSPTKLAMNPFFSILTGVSYWNYKNVERGVGKNNFDNLYSSYDTKFLAIPLMFVYNLQLGVLDNKLKIRFGLGALFLARLQTELHEEAHMYTLDQNYKITNDQFVEDTRDLISSARKITTAYGIELAITYERFFIGLRSWQTVSDEYQPDLANQWNVPTTHSVYLQAHDQFKKMIFSGGGILMGVTIGKK